MPAGKEIDHPPRGGFRVVTIAMNDQIRVYRRLIRGLHAWNMRGFALAGLSINAFGITLDTCFQGTFDLHFQKPRNEFPCAVTIGPTIRGGIENNGHTMLGEDAPNKGDSPVKVLAIQIAIASISGKQFS